VRICILYLIDDKDGTIIHTLEAADGLLRTSRDYERDQLIILLKGIVEILLILKEHVTQFLSLGYKQISKKYGFILNTEDLTRNPCIQYALTLGRQQIHLSPL
jgi:hypothetical protein